MKIQTKLTGFFIVILVVFSYVLVWIGTRAYRREVNRLNAEISRLRLRFIVNQVYDQNNLYFTRNEAELRQLQERAISMIAEAIPQRTPGDKSFPFIIAGDTTTLLQPKNYHTVPLPRDKVPLEELFNKESGKVRFIAADGERIVIYEVFRPWNWLIGYSYPANVDLYREVYSAYFRQIVAVICCMIASVAVLFWLIQKALSPLDQLVENASGMATGIFPKLPKKKNYSNDEIGILNKAFDEMSARIQESMQKLHLEITERRGREQEFRELIENSPLAIAVVQPDWSFSLNEMFTTVFGYSPKHMKRFDQWFTLSAPESMSAKAAATEWKMLLDSDSGSSLCQVKCRNGKILDIEVRHKRIGKQNLLIFNDLTEIREAEKQLRDTRNYLNQLFNSISLLLVAVNRKGIVTQWNQAMEKFTDIKAPGVIGSKIWIIAPFLKNFRNEIEQSIDSGKNREIYREVVNFKKRRYYFNISINPLLDSENKGAVIIMEDVTELVRKNEQLIQAQKMETVGTLTGGLAHDFNNVLGGIKGALSMTKYYLTNSPDKLIEMKDFTKLAEKSVTRASSMVEQLLALSRKSQLSFRPANLNKALDNVLEICRGTFDKSINISVSRPAIPPLVNADQTQIEQVILNLLINAEHAMTIMRPKTEPRGGEIEITLVKDKFDKQLFQWESDAKFCWKISIKDSGVGIPPDIRNRIFDPFVTTKPRGKGTGLGLTMVYNIIDLHKGIIDVKSEPGKGSTFCIYLPELMLEQDSGAVEIDYSEIIHGEGTILIIDDEEAIRITAGKMLESLGYRVLTAENGEDGVDVFKKHRGKLDAILLDIAMPKMSGDEAYLRIKEIDPNVKVLLSSGFTNDDRVMKTLENGADGFIKKPYSIAKLSRKIDEVIRH